MRLFSFDLKALCGRFGALLQQNRPTTHPPRKKAPKVAKYTQNGNFQKCRACKERFGAVWVELHKKKDPRPRQKRLRYKALKNNLKKVK